MTDEKLAMLLTKYTARGGEHPATAIFWDGEEWEVHVGNGRCNAVRLGEVDGEFVGRGTGLDAAIADVEAKL